LPWCEIGILAKRGRCLKTSPLAFIF
jgi:hypothetical protein